MHRWPPARGSPVAVPGGARGPRSRAEPSCSMAPNTPRTVGLGSPAAGLGSPGKRQDPTPHPGLFFLPRAPPTCRPPAPAQATPGPRQNPSPWGAGWGRGQDGGLGAGCTEGLGGMRCRGGEVLASHGARSQPSRRLVRPCPTRCPRAAPGWLRAPSGAGIWDFHQRRGRKPRLQPTELLLTHKFYFDFIFFMCLLFLQLKNRWV